MFPLARFSISNNTTPVHCVLKYSLRLRVKIRVWLHDAFPQFYIIGFWPALACAPNNEVAECLRILILAMLPSSDASTLSSTMARTSIVSPLDQGDEMHVDD